MVLRSAARADRSGADGQCPVYSTNEETAAKCTAPELRGEPQSMLRPLQQAARRAGQTERGQGVDRRSVSSRMTRLYHGLGLIAGRDSSQPLTLALVMSLAPANGMWVKYSLTGGLAGDLACFPCPLAPLPLPREKHTMVWTELPQAACRPAAKKSRPA